MNHQQARHENVQALNQQRIQQVLAERLLSQKRLLPFVKMNVSKYEAGWVHKEICHKLEKFERDVIAKKSPRLMLFMPPRHGKSELASTRNGSRAVGCHRTGRAQEEHPRGHSGQWSGKPGDTIEWH